MNQETEHLEPEEDVRDDRVIAKALFWSLVVLTGMIAVGGIIVAVVVLRPIPVANKGVAYVPPAPRAAVATATLPVFNFTNITQKAGITFMHHNGAEGEKLLPETMGSGCAFFDYDQDGDQDLCFVNSASWPGKPTAGSDENPPTLTLYQNDGHGAFTDVTEVTGLDFACYGMGIACGDYNGDGWVDLYITTVGKNHLLRNDEGQFVDVTEAAGVAGREEEWSTSSGWFDYDRDGDLDLFVGNYVRWSREIDIAQDFRLVGVGRAYGPPMAFEGTFPCLYRNNGDGTFGDVSADAGVQIKNPASGQPMAKTMGIAFVDFNRDGWLDIIVANDTVQNFMLVNQQNGTFAEIGALAGVAFDSSGNARGAMGIDAARFRNDDSLGLVIGNFANEMTALYVSERPDSGFTDDAIATGLGPPTRSELTFGIFFFDADLDGRLDILATNGHLEDEINKVQESQYFAQPPKLYWNAGPGQPSEFVAVPAELCGSDFSEPLVGRGSAYADIDGDGDLDFVLVANHGAPSLFRNNQTSGHNWLRVQLTGNEKNRDAIGAQIQLTAGDLHAIRDVMPTRSYCSQSELTATFGLGLHKTIDDVTIVWPDGTKQQIVSPDVNQVLKVSQK